ncbi:MAG: hypothetical protein AABW90_02050 [Nanoarchaeota archaeon]
MKTQIKNGLAGLLTAGAISLGSLVGYQETSTLQASNYAIAQNEGKAVEYYELKRPKYHPSIEDFEKQLEKEIGSLVPTYYEVVKGFFIRNEKDKELLKEKFLKVRETPKVVQNNKYYKEFSKHLDYHYKNQEKERFIFDVSVSDLIKDNKTNKDLKEHFGFTFNFKNPSEADKAALFLMWTVDKKREKIETNNKNLLFRVLDDINSSERMPTKNYRNEKFLELGAPLYDADYERLLDIADKRLIDVDGKKVEVIHEGAEPIITNLDQEAINRAYSHSPPLPIFISNSFDLKENKKINLGMILPTYLPNREKIRNGKIELYNPKGEKIVDSDFKTDKELKTGEVDLERVVRDNGLGVYNAAFFLDNKCWTVRQFEVDYEMPGLGPPSP